MMNDLTFSTFSDLLDDSLNLSKAQSSRRLFTTTLGKTEEIQIKFNSVKSSLRKGLDDKNNLVTDFLPVIEATQKLEQLLETYWIYFEEKDKNQLEVMANLINDAFLKNGFWNRLRQLITTNFWEDIQLLWRNRKNFKFISEFQAAQLSLAETILDLRDQDKHIQSEEKKIVLSEKDSQLLISFLENPPEPSEGLLSIFKDK
jgi:hypothetical protein